MRPTLGGTATGWEKVSVPLERAVGAAPDEASVTAVIPGVYSHVLKRISEAVVADTHFYYTADADDPALIAEHVAVEAAKIAAYMETQRGQPIQCRTHHLPGGAGDEVQHIRGCATQMWTVCPDDSVVHRGTHRPGDE
jgi:hypothetical protein